MNDTDERAHHVLVWVVFAILGALIFWVVAW